GAARLGGAGGGLVVTPPPHPVRRQLLEHVVDTAALQGRAAVLDRDLLAPDRGGGRAPRGIGLGQGGRGQGKDGGDGCETYLHFERSLIGTGVSGPRHPRLRQTNGKVRSRRPLSLARPAPS